MYVETIQQQGGGSYEANVDLGGRIHTRWARGVCQRGLGRVYT